MTVVRPLEPDPSDLRSVTVDGVTARRVAGLVWAVDGQGHEVYPRRALAAALMEYPTACAAIDAVLTLPHH